MLSLSCLVFLYNLLYNKITIHGWIFVIRSVQPPLRLFLPEKEAYSLAAAGQQACFACGSAAFLLPGAESAFFLPRNRATQHFLRPKASTRPLTSTGHSLTHTASYTGHECGSIQQKTPASFVIRRGFFSIFFRIYSLNSGYLP